MPTPRKAKPSDPPPPANLSVPREDARQRIADQIAKGNEIKGLSIQSQKQLDAARQNYDTWHAYNAELLRRLFDTAELADEYNHFGVAIGFLGPRSLYDQVEDFHNDVQKYIGRLNSIIGRLDLIPEKITVPARTTEPTHLQAVERTLRRFPAVARQLRRRHAGRQTISVEDEYDVQDLLHALLRVFFDDIRAEEWTPSYAGGSGRMDFLLKAERTVIEVKKTREGLRDREIGNQLMEDIGRYRAHPDCRTLVCFVFDPDGWITNPDGMERDLRHSADEIDVQVIIAPKNH